MENIYTIERETEIWRGVDGTEQLNVLSEYPLFTSASKGFKRINVYYNQRNQRFLKLCKIQILPKTLACENIQPVEVRIKSRVTYSDDNVISVLTDITYSAFAEPMRRADIWDRKTGNPVEISEVFPSGVNIKRLIKRQVAEKIVQQSKFYRRFYPNAEKRFTRYLSLNNIYLESSGTPVLFFPQNTIAPRGEGFVQFVINDTVK